MQWDVSGGPITRFLGRSLVYVHFLSLQVVCCVVKIADVSMCECVCERDRREMSTDR